MSQERPAGSPTARSIDERIALAMPSSVMRAMAWALARLPPGSTLRRRLLKRIFALGLRAGGRGDDDVALLFFEPDVEFRLLSDVPRTLGLAETYRGRQGYLDAWRDYREEADDLHFEIEHIVDLGDRIAIRGNLVGRGRASGIDITDRQGQVFYLSPRGLVARVDLYRDWDRALADLGLEE
jgi:ketosteroid isomerase-like protein